MKTMRICEYYESSSRVTYELKKESILGEELNKLQKDIFMVQKLQPIIDYFIPLKNSYDKFEKWKYSGEIDNNQIDEIVSDYLSKTKSYIDQLNSFLLDQYSDVHSFFNKERMYMYDQSFAYRLIYNLRNMDYHTYKAPFTTVSITLNELPILTLEKDYFLNSHKAMQTKVAKELIELNQDSFNLVEKIDQSYIALSKLNDKTFNEIVNNLKQDGLINSAYNLRHFYKEHQKKGGGIGLTNEDFDALKINNKDHKQALSFKHIIPIQLAEFCIKHYDNNHVNK